MLAQVARALLYTSSIGMRALQPSAAPDPAGQVQVEFPSQSQDIPLRVNSRLPVLFRESAELLANGPARIAGSRPGMLAVQRFDEISREELNLHIEKLRGFLASEHEDCTGASLPRHELQAVLENNQRAVRSLGHFLNSVAYSREVVRESVAIEKRLGIAQPADFNPETLEADRKSQMAVYESLVRVARLNQEIHSDLISSEPKEEKAHALVMFTPELRAALLETCTILNNNAIDGEVADTLSLAKPMSIEEAKVLEEQLKDPSITGIDAAVVDRLAKQARRNVNSVLGKAHGEGSRVSILLGTLKSYPATPEREALREELALREKTALETGTELARQAARLDELRKLTGY